MTAKLTEEVFSDTDKKSPTGAWAESALVLTSSGFFAELEQLVDGAHPMTSTMTKTTRARSCQRLRGSRLPSVGLEI